MVGSGKINPQPQSFNLVSRPSFCIPSYMVNGRQPSKHYYARRREMILGAKGYTVGKQGLRSLGNHSLPGQEERSPPVPTFFCVVTGKLIGPTDRRNRKAWRFRMKQANN